MKLEDKIQQHLDLYKPEGVRVVSTYKCNRNCTFCYQDGKESVLLTADKFEDILRISKSKGFMPIYFTFQGGEVSNYPEETYELIKLSDKYYPQVFRKSVTSNGYGDFSFYKNLKLYGITHLTFSLHKKNKFIEDRLILLKSDGFYTVRVNCYLDIDNIQNVAYVLDFCKEHKIQLTICEDLRLSSNVDYDSTKLLKDNYIIDDTYIEEKFKHQNVFYSEAHNFRFWVYRHLNHYDYNNIIVMPNGDITITFDDIIHCKGNE